MITQTVREVQKVTFVESVRRFVRRQAAKFLADTPLIYTTKGNLPVEGLRVVFAWEHTESFLHFHETYYQGDELVRKSTHVYGIPGQAAKVQSNF